MLLEKDLEDIISKYPDIIEEGLTLQAINTVWEKNGSAF
jgi:hypothetical protein